MHLSVCRYINKNGLRTRIVSEAFEKRVLGTLSSSANCLVRSPNHHSFSPRQKTSEACGQVPWISGPYRFFFIPCGTNSNPGLSPVFGLGIFCISLKLLQLLRVTIGKSVSHYFNLIIIFQLPWKLAVILEISQHVICTNSQCRKIDVGR